MLAAIEEFAHNGYKAASTNAIVQKAEVSKGLLFHYYTNKEELYLECSQYVIEKMMAYFFERLSFSDDDVFNRFKHALELKMRFFCEHEALASLSYSLWNSELRTVIEERIREYLGGNPDNKNYIAKYMSVLLENADLTKLYEDVDIHRVLDYIGILFDACWLRFANKYCQDPNKIVESMGEFLSEADDILTIVRRGVYKPE